jgi:hypothetical protein
MSTTAQLSFVTPTDVSSMLRIAMAYCRLRRNEPPSEQRSDSTVTIDPHEGCVSLVTPEFVRADFGNSIDPMATCRKKFHIHRLGSLPVPRNIRIQSVTGVENLTATVTYREIPDCGCGTFTTRLFFEHGRWLIQSVTTGP